MSVCAHTTFLCDTHSLIVQGVLWNDVLEKTVQFINGLGLLKWETINQKVFAFAFYSVKGLFRVNWIKCWTRGGDRCVFFSPYLWATLINKMCSYFCLWQITININQLLDQYDMKLPTHLPKTVPTLGHVCLFYHFEADGTGKIRQKKPCEVQVKI